MRLISLSVRLYANMLAGHILILTMIGLIFIIHSPPWRFFGLPAAFIFYVFEVVIVVTIQAFISPPCPPSTSARRSSRNTRRSSAR